MSQNDVQQSGSVVTSDNPFIQLVQQWKIIVTEPTNFFANLVTEGDLTEAIKFYGVIAVTNSVFQLLMGLAKPMAALQSAGLSLICLMIGSFVWAGITMWLSRLLGGNGSYNATYRACAYASAPNIVAWIPLVGFFAWLYSLFLLRLGIERVHGLEKSRAITVIAIEVGAMLIVMIVMAFVVFGALVKPTTGAGI